MIVLSFCIPVYNQWELVKSCIDSIVGYRKNDIEIVISDDCSNEDIESLINGYKDDRIKYFRNEKNLGHDLNIIASFKHAKGKFAFLLRTRDKIIADSIPVLIEHIQSQKNISYITGSALDESGNLALHYENRYYKRGAEALNAHLNLYIHPSGSAYCLDNLELELLEQFLKANIETKYSFVVHNLIRIQLSQLGDFETIDKPIWIYANTLHADDVAVNSSKNNKSVYSSEYTNKRYQCEMIWANQVVEKRLHLYIYRYLFKSYLNQATWLYKLSNQNQKLQQHYNFKPKFVSIKLERKKFIELSKRLKDKLLEKEDTKKFDLIMRKELLLNRTIGAIKYIILRYAYIFKLNRFMSAINKLRYRRRLL